MFADQTWLARAIWLALAGVVLFALVEGRLELAFVALGTLALSYAPVVVAKWTDVHVPPSFIAALVIFVGATLFLGEVYDFYERFWWWDMVMHGASAVGFGLIGFVLRQMNYPMAPLVLGIILGDLLDKNLRRGLTLSDGSLEPFFTRPVSALFAAVIAASILLGLAPVRRGLARLAGIAGGRA